MDFDDSPLNDPPAPLETWLAALSPHPGTLSPSRLLFEAGAADGRRRARSYRLLWGIAALLPAIVSTTLYVQERGRTQFLGTTLAVQERRLDALERRSDVFASRLADPSFAPTRGGYLRLRTQWLSGTPEPETPEQSGPGDGDSVAPPLLNRIGARSLEL